MKSNATLVNPYPKNISIEGIEVAALLNPESLFERIYLETLKKKQSVVAYLNIHVANTAFWNIQLRKLLEEADLVYCDGEGIVLGSKLLATPLPTRLTAANWFSGFVRFCYKRQLTVFLLGGLPGIPEKALANIQRDIGDASTSVVGYHHGYFLKDPVLENQVIANINSLQPDVLIVGFGTPLQEQWIQENRSRLRVSTFYALGAILDFVSETVPRCPDWMGSFGLEWLYRLLREPKRLFFRYVIGNPWFISRIGFRSVTRKLAAALPFWKPDTAPLTLSK
jgi:N-acetylglucosaminyldiphosphoundecaprenol N-acetyl-beta-D-mannosaminyltransferase